MRGGTLIHIRTLRCGPSPLWWQLCERSRQLRHCLRKKRDFDLVRRQRYWEVIAEFDERLIEAVWSSRIAISLDHPDVPMLRPAFRYAWLGLIDIIEQRRKGTGPERSNAVHASDGTLTSAEAFWLASALLVSTYRRPPFGRDERARPRCLPASQG